MRALSQTLVGLVQKHILNRPVLRKILSNASWLVADRAMRMAVSLFVGMWVIRYLGPERYGIYSYALAFAALFSPFADLGLRQIVVRNLVAEAETANLTLGTTFLLKLVGGVIAFGLPVAIIVLLRPHDIITCWLVGILSARGIFRAFHVIGFFFQSRLQSKYTVAATGVAFLAANIGKITLILVRAPLIAFAWVMVAESAIAAAGLLMGYRITGRRFRHLGATFQCARDLLRDSWPLILSGLAIAVYMRIDVIMLREMRGNEDAGIYAAAVRISSIWYFIPMAIASSAFPSIVEAKSANQLLYIQRLQKLFNFGAGLSYAVAIPLTFLAGPVVRLLCGSGYSAAGPVLAIHIWAGLFSALGTIRALWLVSEGLMKFSFASTLAGMLANVLLNCCLIPSFGALGAAVATVASYSIVVLFSCFFYRRTHEVGFMILRSVVLASLIFDRRNDGRVE